MTKTKKRAAPSGPPLRTFSYGGGVQSFAMLVLSAHATRASAGDEEAAAFLLELTHGRYALAHIIKALDFPIYLFSNVGDDSEKPATLSHVREVAMPYAAANGITLLELTHTRADGEQDTLYKKLTRENSRSTGIPIRLEGSGSPGRRSCTADFKIRRIAVWQRRAGASKEAPAVCGLGISVDEFQRMRTDSGVATQVLEYPLIELRMSRQDCVHAIERAGLPVPPKSACYFCPFSRLHVWQELKLHEPDLFDKAVALEKLLSDRNEALGRGRAFFSSRMRPLGELFGDQMELDLFGNAPAAEPALLALTPGGDEPDDTCDSGFCMT